MFKSVLTVFVLLFSIVSLHAMQEDKTPPKDLVQYVRDMKKAGKNQFQIQQAAVDAGWPAATVNEAIAAVYTPDAAGSAAGAVAAKPAPEPASPVAAAEPAKSPAASGTTPPAATPSGPMPAGATPAGTGAAPNETAKPVDSVKPADTAKAADASAASTAGAAGTKPLVVNRGVSDDYQIGAGDMVSVNVWGEKEASLGSTAVRADGKITMPLLHEVEIAGLTPTQAEKLISDGLSKFLTSVPDVTVSVSGTASKKIYLLGQVKRVGPLPYAYQMTVMQALSEAGGITDYAKKKKIYIVRTEEGKEFRIPFDYDAVLKGTRLEMNIVLIPGDTIVVP